jgi:hypothetical protein
MQVVVLSRLAVNVLQLTVESTRQDKHMPTFCTLLITITAAHCVVDECHYR